jgi:hypothetical protein
MWLPLGIAALLVTAFLLALYLGEQKERPSQIEWKLSEGAGGNERLRRSSRSSFLTAPSESFYDVSRSSLAMYRERRAALSGKGGRPGVGPSDSQPAPHVSDWKQEAVFIRPPTGPDLLVLDLQERTRL